ncbi:adenine-specific DNA-methyltransferase [Trinickia symbiotica]|uniref:site-specific DNA-methyltransferase n=1 Tax=Trinickia symbiotica TaxID=863227 RepID=UPI000CECCBC0|nr:site-specific DNA-methyltransferase [Trinickia symbiotica]PPK44173.1 adenine-specific DNA-methyltransferase [Trinickia symbiotica]
MPFLDWVNKNQAKDASLEVPYHLLKRERTYGDNSATDNLIVQGDNLLALKALLPFYAGRVKCIFIDPPYNTQSAFIHYDDNLEHSQWLSMIYPRLSLLRELLAEDGSIWVTVDDNEAHYLKVVMDEIFGRRNFIANAIWEKKSAPQSNSTWLSDSHDHVLAFARDKSIWRPSKLPRTEEQNQIYKNSDAFDGVREDGTWYGRGPWYADNFTLSLKSGQRGKQFAKTGESANIYEIVTPSGRVTLPPPGRAWSYTKDSYEKLVSDNRMWFGKDGSNKPTIKRFLSELQVKGVVPTTVWHYREVGENRIAAQELLKLSTEFNFSTPKPEALIQRVLQIASAPNDLVLDSFLGSGTTAAVAHKMGRRYIGIEIGEHAITHCVPRLEKVIAGEQGGISEANGWKGGGGFTFCTLDGAAFDENGGINPNVSFSMLAAYIWHIETGTPATQSFDSPLLGIRNGVAYYLLYSGVPGDRRPNGGNVFTRAALAALREYHPHEGPVVVYGEASRIGPATLAAENITFKQIPYDVKMR